jgi:uncharacterized membrane protein YkvI
MRSGAYAFWIGVVIVVSFVVLVIFLRQADDCTAKGGVMVRGAFGYSCVSPR